MTEATPRPVYAIANNWETTTIYDASGAPLCELSLRFFPVTEENQDEWESRQAANAALIVRAVNNYDEALALLREAADSLQYAARVLRGEGIGDPDEHMDIAARIRKALGETT